MNMIFDTIENAKQYQGIHPGVDKVLEAVTAYTPDHYPVGRVTLDGMNLYMNLEEFVTHSKEDGKAEAHQKYIDVMYLVEGSEIIYVKSTEKLQNVTKEYDVDRDILVADIDVDAMPVRLEAGNFVVLFPQDAHGPGCNAGVSAGKVKKIVGKVRIVPCK